MTTPLPFSPFLDQTLIDHEKRFAAEFDPKRFWRDMTSTDEDPPPLFIGGPSPDFDAMLLEIATTLEASARR